MAAMFLRRIGRCSPVVLLALALPGSASAHARLVRSSPADRAVLASAPREARFVFDDRVRPASGVEAVRNGDGSVVQGHARSVGGRTLVVPLRGGLGEGDYTVLWKIVSDDGHREAGVITFAVGAGRAPPVAALSASSGSSVKDVISRWLFLAGLLVAVGGSLFRLAVGPASVRAVFVGFVLAFLGGSGEIAHASFSTRFGVVMAVATVVAAAGAALAGIAAFDSRVEPAAFLVGLLLLPAPSLAGHALDAGRPRLEVLVDLLHVSAASLWVGGLVALLLRLRVGDGRAVQRFSAVAVASVGVLAATGVLSALAELRSVEQLWTTWYGRLLIVKTGLLALLVCIGWLNRYRLVPRGALLGLRRSVSGELVLLAGLVVAVAILTDARPGRDHAVASAAPSSSATVPPLPLGDAVVLAREDGDLAVAVAAERRRLRVTVLGPDGTAARGLRVTVHGERTRDCGAGCYEAAVSPAPTVPVTVSGRTLVFDLPRNAPSAAGLLARATKAFRSLRSVRYVERLASSPRNHIVSEFTLERPDRIEYRIRGGASGIVIGTRRWDRAGPRAPWTPSSSVTLPQPVPSWGSPLRNAHLLARTREAYLVSMFNPRVPAWFTVLLDRRTLLPRTLEMTAAAHFMHHRYVAYNRTRSIFPP
jgi:copper transport protein